MKSVGLVLLSILVLGGALAYGFRKPLTMLAVERIVQANMSGSLLDELPDGLHVVLCGAGSPLADPLRSGPCTAVIAGDQLWIVDAGSGASRMLARLRIPQGEIDGVLVTHFHSDHIDGLGELLLQRWVNSAATEPLPLHGPTGIAAVSEGLAQAYYFDSLYRVAHHGPEIVPPSGAGSTPHPHRINQKTKASAIIQAGELTISAIRVDHEPVKPAFGYRFDYKGRSLVISGDTRRSKAVQTASAGVDLLIHEALSPRLVERLTRAAEQAGRANIAKITRDILDYHTTPIEAAEVAAEAGVGHLLFNHIVPPLPLPPMEEIFVEGVGEVYDGPVTVGRDGVRVMLPANSDAIEVDRLL